MSGGGGGAKTAGRPSGGGSGRAALLAGITGGARLKKTSGPESAESKQKRLAAEDAKKPVSAQSGGMFNIAAMAAQAHKKRDTSAIANLEKGLNSRSSSPKSAPAFKASLKKTTTNDRSSAGARSPAAGSGGGGPAVKVSLKKTTTNDRSSAAPRSGATGAAASDELASKLQRRLG